MTLATLPGSDSLENDTMRDYVTEGENGPSRHGLPALHSGTGEDKARPAIQYYMNRERQKDEQRFLQKEQHLRDPEECRIEERCQKKVWALLLQVFQYFFCKGASIPGNSSKIPRIRTLEGSQR